MHYNPPGALSSRGWKLFSKEFQKNAPIRYWFEHDFKHDIIYPIKWKYDAIADWIRYRTYDRYHVVKTGLKPGYHSIDSQMLNVNFNMFKDFIECELAWAKFRWGTDAAWYQKMRFIRRYIRTRFRNPELGLAYLDWASALDDLKLPPQERCEHQAIAAREMRILYDWWVNKRPERKSIEIPMLKYIDDSDLLDDHFDKDSSEYKEYEEAVTARNELNEKWENEDDLMLIRLIKIRNSLWS